MLKSAALGGLVRALTLTDCGLDPKVSSTAEDLALLVEEINGAKEDPLAVFGKRGDNRCLVLCAGSDRFARRLPEKFTLKHNRHGDLYERALAQYQPYIDAGIIALTEGQKEELENVFNRVTGKRETNQVTYRVRSFDLSGEAKKYASEEYKKMRLAADRVLQALF